MTRNFIPCADLLKRLREGREKLAPVDAAFELSYGLLNEELRYQLILLAVFPLALIECCSGSMGSRR